MKLPLSVYFSQWLGLAQNQASFVENETEIGGGGNWEPVPEAGEEDLTYLSRPGLKALHLGPEDKR